MCGRYALALRPSQVRRLMEDNDVPVSYAPDDDGDGAPRQSYNFAPGYHGIVYRADVSDRGAGPARDDNSEDVAPSGESNDAVDSSDTSNAKPKGDVKYKLQSMKWGLVPFWTKRNPDYGSIMRTINCRDDSLSTSGGMWSSMKARKRCIVIAQGFFEWLKTGPKDKLPHFVKRKDGQLMCFAGLWDCVQYDGSDEKNYTYTIITTDSNKQLKFLHDRMPVIFDATSDSLRKWVDPSRYEWNRELQALLKPFEGKLDVYPVSKEVGKVGNNSPSFIIPIDSKENKSNIANFFANASQKQKKGVATGSPHETDVKREKDMVQEPKVQTEFTLDETTGQKRKPDPRARADSPPTKMTTPMKTSQNSRSKISATHNKPRSPAKPQTAGSQKITKFFGNSA